MSKSIESIIQDFCRPGQDRDGSLVENSNTMLKIVLELVKERWIQVIRDQERHIVYHTGSQRLVTADVRLADKQVFDGYLKRAAGLLEADLKTVSAFLGKSNLKPDRPIWKTLEQDFNFMKEKILLQIKENSSTIPAITAMMAVEESRKAIEQATDVK
jgi:hypothetical protein